MKRLKLAYVCPWFSTKYRGPLYNFLNELSKHLDVVCICSKQKYVQYFNHNEKHSEMIEEINPHFKIHRFDSVAPKNIIYPFDIETIFDEERPDVIQSDEFFRFTTIKSGKWAIKNNVPLFINSRMRYRQGFLRNFLLRIFKSLSRKVVNYSEILAVQGPASEKEFLRWFPNKKISASIPTGLDIKEFTKQGKEYNFRNKYGILKNKKIVLSVARIYPVKRIDLALESFVKIKKESPNAVLVNVGPAEERELVKIKKIILEKGLELGKDVFLIGSIDNKDLAPAYASAEVFLNTSETEGICFSFLEAMTFKLPLVAFDVGGNSGVIENGRNGYLKVFGDIEGVAKEILEILKDKALKEKLGGEGYRKLNKEFDVKKNVRRLIEIIKNEK